MTTNHNLASNLIEAIRARYTREGWTSDLVETLTIGFLTGVLAEGMNRSEEFKKAVEYYTANNNEQV